MPTAPAILKVNLAYYNKKQQRLFSAGNYASANTAAKVSAFQTRGEIPLADFLNYFLIHRAKNSFFATYAARNRMLDTAISMLEHVITTVGSINCQPGSEDLQKWVGESLSLSVVGSMFCLTAADWATIPVMQVSGFDFERVFTGITIGNNIIQVEAKGSFVADNTQPQGAVYSHAKDIRKKKGKILAAGSAYPHPAAIRFGVIASIDPKQPARCLLIDPPGDVLPGDPRRLKIASRLQHLSLIVSLLAPNAQLPRALFRRAVEWRALDRAEPQGRLTSSNGYAFTPFNYVEDYLAQGKVWLKEQDVVGHLFQIDPTRQIFLGLKGEVIRAAIQQDIQAIIHQTFQPSSTTMEISALPVTVRALGVDGVSEERTHQLTFHSASSGVVIGVPHIAA